MRISILLPYKENFSPEYPGAVSLFVYETSRISKFRKSITVFGNTNFKKIFNLKYININTKKEFFYSQTKNYVNNFVKLETKNNSAIIEVHNRPSYIHIINSQLKNKILTLYKRAHIILYPKTYLKLNTKQPYCNQILQNYHLNEIVYI